MSKRPRERTTDILDVRMLEDKSCGSITNDIATFLNPVSLPDFIASIHRNKALAVKVHPKLREVRLTHLKEVLHNFNPLQMLRDSNSEKIMAWVPNARKSGDDEPGARTIHSVKLSTPEEAKGCYDAGCGLYFRSSEDLESEFVPAYSEALGHSFAAFFRDGQRRGEIETFVTHVGHATDWHYDFQDNFTVQLRGSKKWFLRKGPVQHPYRGFAPHYKDTKVLHTQIQIARCANPQFRGLGDDGGLVFDESEECETVVLQPGDVLYHPAGMLHRVETIAVGEDRSNSLSINISLFPQTWGELLTDTIQQLALTCPELRETIRFGGDVAVGQGEVRRRLSALLSALQSIQPQFVLPRAALHPIGVVTVRSKGVVREDGMNNAAVVAPPTGRGGGWRRSPLGVLSETPERVYVPLFSRPPKSSTTESDDDDVEEDEDDDNGDVEIPERAVRFDFHANFVADEASPHGMPAVHSVLVVHHDALPIVRKLASIPAGGNVLESDVQGVPGLAAVLLDLGYMAASS